MCERDMGYFHGHGRIEYNTPQWLFDALNVEFGFTVDAAAAKGNAKCKRYYSAEDDGLAKDWTDEVVWVNPPYGKGITTKWVAKAPRRYAGWNAPWETPRNTRITADLKHVFLNQNFHDQTTHHHR